MKLEEFDEYPLASQLGFMHAIPEEDINMATSMIIDVFFLGFFPKRSFKCCINMRRRFSNLVTWK